MDDGIIIIILCKRIRSEVTVVDVLVLLTGHVRILRMMHYLKLFKPTQATCRVQH